MKISPHLSFAAALLSSSVFARWIPFSRSNSNWISARSNDNGCSFTISSAGSFVCPLGELPDGQIRANSSEDTATFHIKDGSITDSMGFGCIVTAPPTTQVQCDSGATPDPNFSIDPSGNLLYKGSPQFFACPATDTEYNIYINPDFGQKKCFPITLQASGCGAAPTSTCPPASTITTWQTQTVAQTVGTTVTVVVTSTAQCPTTTAPFITPTPTTPPFQNTTSCHHCTKTASM